MEVVAFVFGLMGFMSGAAALQQVQQLRKRLDDMSSN